MFLKTDGAGNLSFASLSFATPLTVIGDNVAGASIRLPEDTDNGSNYVAIKAPDNLASNLTLTLPSADGTSGQVLQTNGSGVLSFAGVSASAGQVIQVVTATTGTSTSTTTTASFVSTNLTASITPSSSSNKVLILITTTTGISNGADSTFTTIFRGSTNLAGSGNAISRTYAGQSTLTINHCLSFLDSPATTSSTAYTLYFANGNGGGCNINSYYPTITLLEVKG